MKAKFLAAALIAFGSLAGGANGASVIDDFNDGIADGWTSQTGTITIAGGQAFGSLTSLHTFDLATGNSISAIASLAGSSVSYVALVAGYSSISDNLFVKLQDNDQNGLFDKVYFYHGNNGSLGVGLTGGIHVFSLSTQVASSRISLELDGLGGASFTVDATGQTFGGTLAHSYTSSIVGLGFYGQGRADDFSVVPEPSSALLCAFGACGLLRRRRTA